jgi:hypothetical protein
MGQVFPDENLRDFVGAELGIILRIEIRTDVAVGSVLTVPAE